MDSFYNLKLLKSILFKEIPIISFEKNKKLYLFRYFNKYLGPSKTIKCCKIWEQIQELDSYWSQIMKLLKFSLVCVLILCPLAFAGKIDTSRFDSLNKVLKTKTKSTVNLKDGIKEAEKLLKDDVSAKLRRQKQMGAVLSLPYRCSMKTRKGRYQDIMNSLKALTAKIKVGNCKSEGSAYINQMDSVFKNWKDMSETTEATKVFNSNAPAPDPNAAVDSATATPAAADIYFTQARVMAVSQVLKNFGNLAQKAGCQYELKKTDTLQILRDVISNISSVGLLVPGQAGALTALGGTGLVGVIEMIRNLISTKWDWHNEKDRDTFVDLNCGFYTLQNELEKETLFNIKTDQNKLDQKRLTEEVKKFKVVVAKLRNGIHVSEKSSKRFKETEKRLFITKNFSEETYFLLNTIKNAGKVSHGMAVNAKTIPQRGAVIEELIHLHKEFFRYIDKSKVSYYGTFLVSETKDNFKDIFGVKATLSGNKINLDKNKVLSKFLTKKNKFDELVKKFNEPIFWLADDIHSEISKKSGNEKHFDPLVSKAERVLASIEKRLDKKVKQLARVNQIQTGKFEFDMEDSGTMDRINLKAKYNEIQNVIYGKAGASFLEYSIKHSYNALWEFEKHFDATFGTRSREGDMGARVLRNFKPAGKKAREICANIDKMMKDFAEGDDLVQAGFDFLVINERHFLRTPGKKSIWDVFKIDYYKKKYLYTNFNEANKINKLLKKGIFFNPGGYSKKGIARQMIMRSNNLTTRINLQTFHDRSCRRF